MKVVVSNGTYKFHLAPLASELQKSGILKAFFTAGYPKGIALKLLGRLKLERVKHLVSRRELIPDHLVHAFNLTEVYFKIGDLIFANRSKAWQYRFHVMGFELYARKAKNTLKSTPADIYHYRNCYGLTSAKWAQDNGMKTICDHSIGHPYAISYLLNVNANLPGRIDAQPLTLLDQHSLKDFEHADAVLVNSEFVKQTFVACGYSPEKVFVVYWGVDNQFLAASDNALSSKTQRKSARHLLFCGQWGYRKGSLLLMDALEALHHEDWTLTIAGEDDLSGSDRWREFKAKYSDRISIAGILPRDELAKLMSEHQVFIFPTLVEGSARVIFEALATGCFVITTPNSGSIVEEGVHGTIMAPGSSDSIVKALERVWSDQYEIAEISSYNQGLIREKFRQDQYAAKVLDVYQQVLHS